MEEEKAVEGSMEEVMETRRERDRKSAIKDIIQEKGDTRNRVKSLFAI